MMAVKKKAPPAYSKRLRARRKELRLTQEAIADHIGVQPPTYSRFETGTRRPSVAHCMRLQSILEWSPLELNLFQKEIEKADG